MQKIYIIERERERKMEGLNLKEEKTYRKFNKAKDKHGPKATKKRIRKIATKEGQEKDSSNKVCHNICGI